MGCDIHPHFEVKVNGRWEHYSVPRIQRWYALFTKIAGVRAHGDEITPIALPKGLPDDLSVVTLLEAQRIGVDGHSHTWLNAEEIVQLLEWNDNERDECWRFEHEQLGYLNGSGWDAFHKYPQDAPGWVQDIRFVCWFDN